MGNFKATLEFRALGDPVLRQHHEHGQKNAQYTSPRTQNEIIAICKLLIIRKIVEKVRENELYSIMCDECTDVSNKEQMSLSVRFVADAQIHEAFLGFFELDEGTTGRVIASVIETALATCQVDVTKMRGQAYDGASNMSARAIQWLRNSHSAKIHPLAVYSNCCSHVLNFAEVKACNLVLVQTYLAQIARHLFLFFLITIPSTNMC